MLYEHLERNRRMTVVLFVLFTLVLLGVAFALDVLWFGGGPVAVTLITLALAAVAGSWAWFAADRTILGAVGARPPDPSRAAERALPEIVSGLALAAGLPTPRVLVIDDHAPNAFATGRSPEKGVTVFTTGLLEKMSRHELEAVAAHELSHIANRDSLVGVLAAVLAGTVAIVARLALRGLFYGGGRARRRGGGKAGAVVLIIGIAVLVLAPIFGLLLRFAVSRRRESLADANAVRLTRNPDAMIGALEVLHGDKTSVDFRHGLASNLWIEEPEEDRSSFLDRAFRTHPPIPERISALRAMRGDFGYR